MNEIKTPSAETSTEIPLRSPNRLTLRDLLALDVTELPMLWDGFLPSTEIALLAGIGGYGKSTLARQLAIAIARGDSHFLTRKLNAPNRRVIYVSCEDGKQKTASIVRRYGESAADGLIFVFGSTSLKDVLNEIHAEMELAPVDLILIDSLGNLFNGEQNSNSDAQSFYREFDWFAQRTTVLFLHHIRKNDHRNAPDQVSIQGAGAFVQRARAVLMLTGEKHQTERYLHMEKENDVSDKFKFEALRVEFDRELKRYSSNGETIPVIEIGMATPHTKDWESLFLPGENELSTAVLVERIMIKRHIHERAAKEQLKKSGLEKVGHGKYRRPGSHNVQSAESAKVQKVQAHPTESAADQSKNDTK